MPHGTNCLAGQVASEELLPKSGGGATRKTVLGYAKAVRGRYLGWLGEKDVILSDFCGKEPGPNGNPSHTALSLLVGN